MSCAVCSMITLAERDAESVRDACEGSCFSILNLLRTGETTLDLILAGLCANHRAISDLTLDKLILQEAARGNF